MLIRGKQTALAKLFTDAPIHTPFWKIYKSQIDKNSFKTSWREMLNETIENHNTAMFAPLNSIQVYEEYISCKV